MRYIFLTRFHRRCLKYSISSKETEASDVWHIRLVIAKNSVDNKGQFSRYSTNSIIVVFSLNVFLLLESR